jgi:predicted negative regulator of RcsB-dependent stress response
MGLKEVKQYAKDELSSDEKLLESVLKFEGLYKKHKVKIFATLVIVILAVVAMFGYDKYKEYQYANANAALLKLVENPEDKVALTELEANNKALYDLYSYKIASSKNDTKKLEELSKSEDKLISDLSKYTLGTINNKPVNSEYYKDLNTIMQANVAISKKEYQTANSLLDSIAQNSPLINIATLYRHYTLSGVKR